jgi:hypothetical protein
VDEQLLRLIGQQIITLQEAEHMRDTAIGTASLDSRIHIGDTSIKRVTIISN